MNDHKEHSKQEISKIENLLDWARCGLWHNHSRENEAHSIYEKELEYLKDVFLRFNEATIKTKALEEENKRLKEKLVDREKMHEIDKKKLLFKDAVELPCKDAEYELLQQSNAKLIEVLEEIPPSNFRALVKYLDENDKEIEKLTGKKIGKQVQNDLLKFIDEQEKLLKEHKK